MKALFSFEILGNTNPVTVSHLRRAGSSVIRLLTSHQIQIIFIHTTMSTSEHRAVFNICSDIFWNHVPNWDWLESLISCVLCQLYTEYLKYVCMLDDHVSVWISQGVRWCHAESLETMCVIWFVYHSLIHVWMSDMEEWRTELHSDLVLLFSWFC